MAGQATMKTRDEVRSTIKRIEKNSSCCSGSMKQGMGGKIKTEPTSK